MPSPGQLSVPAMAAVAATMKPATVATTAVEPTATMKPASTTESATAMEPAAKLTATGKPSSGKALMNKSAASKVVTIESAEARASKEPRTKERPSAESVEPWAGADKHAIHEPFRAVVAVWRARVRVIIIVAVGTYGRWANIGRAHSHAHNHSLRARKRSAKEANAE